MDDVVYDLRQMTGLNHVGITAHKAADAIEALRRQNHELVTEIKIRDGIISDLQERLAVYDFPEK